MRTEVSAIGWKIMCGKNIGKFPELLRGRKPELLQEAKVVEFAPFFADFAVNDAPDGDAAGFELFAGGRKAVALSGIGAGAGPDNRDKIGLGDSEDDDHFQIGKGVFPAARRVLILLQSDRGFDTVIDKVRSVDLIGHLEFALIEDFVKYAAGDRFVSLL